MGERYLDFGLRVEVLSNHRGLEVLVHLDDAIGDGRRLRPIVLLHGIDFGFQFVRFTQEVSNLLRHTALHETSLH